MNTKKAMTPKQERFVAEYLNAMQHVTGELAGVEARLQAARKRLAARKAR